MSRPTPEELAAYEQKLKEWYEHMDKLKPKPEAYGWVPGGQEAYERALSTWEMTRACDAPNRPGYDRANND